MSYFALFLMRRIGMESVKDRLEQLMQVLGIKSQTEFARRVGVSRTTITEILNGKNTHSLNEPIHSNEGFRIIGTGQEVIARRKL